MKRKRLFSIFILSLLVISFLVLPCAAAEEDASSSLIPYDSIYDLVNTYIYGGDVLPGTYEDLVCTQVSTIACVLFILLPFLVVFWIVRRVV